METFVVEKLEQSGLSKSRGDAVNRYNKYTYRADGKRDVYVYTCVYYVCVFGVNKLALRGDSPQWWKIDARGLAVFWYYLSPREKSRRRRRKKKIEKKTG